MHQASLFSLCLLFVLGVSDPCVSILADFDGTDIVETVLDPTGKTYQNLDTECCQACQANPLCDAWVWILPDAPNGSPYHCYQKHGPGNNGVSIQPTADTSRRGNYVSSCGAPTLTGVQVVQGQCSDAPKSSCQVQCAPGYATTVPGTTSWTSAPCSIVRGSTFDFGANIPSCDVLCSLPTLDANSGLQVQAAGCTDASSHICTLTCATGYETDSFDSLSCTTLGGTYAWQWLPDSYPHCTGSPCQAASLASVPFADLNNCNSAIPSGSSCTETCSAGYVATGGSGLRKCVLGNGNLTDSTLICSPIHCEVPASLARGLLITAGSCTGTGTCVLSCAPGFAPASFTSFLCSGTENNYLWNEAPHCEANSCTVSDISSSDVHAAAGSCFGTLLDGDSCSEVCVSGWERSPGTTGVRNCIAGELSANSLTCTAVTCTAPVLGLGLEFVPSGEIPGGNCGSAYGSACVIRCQNGYVPNTFSSTCTTSGPYTFSANAKCYPTCNSTNNMACNAFRWAFPLWTFTRFLVQSASTVQFKTNQIGFKANIVPPPLPTPAPCDANICQGQVTPLNRAPVVAPSSSFLYGAAFLDLLSPVQLIIPNASIDDNGAVRFYTVEILDFFTNTVGKIDSSTHSTGGRFCLTMDTGSGCSVGTFAENFISLPRYAGLSIRVKTNGTSFSSGGSTFYDGGQFLLQMAVIPLPAPPPPPKSFPAYYGTSFNVTLGCPYIFPPSSHYDFCGIGNNPQAFWETVCLALADNPLKVGTPEFAYVMQNFASFGITPTGCVNTTVAAQASVLYAGLVAGWYDLQLGITTTSYAASHDTYPWIMIDYSGSWGVDFLSRAQASYRLLFMNPKTETLYYTAFTDSFSFDPLHADWVLLNLQPSIPPFTYGITFDPNYGIPANFALGGFWSVTIYDSNFYLGNSPHHTISGKLGGVTPDPIVIANCSILFPPNTNCLQPSSTTPFFNLVFRIYLPTIPSYAEAPPPPPGDSKPPMRLPTITKCAPGSFLKAYSDATGKEILACLVCPPGSYSSEGGVTTCTNCAPGKFATFVGQNSCAQCPDGQTSMEGQIFCTQCQLGTFSVGGQPCTLCPPGFFSNNSGHSFCFECDAGTFAPPGSMECSPCDTGLTNEEAGSSSCLSAQTTTTLSVTPATSTFGVVVTMTATVAAIVTDLPPPTGNVQFFDGANSLGTSPLVLTSGKMQAVFATNALTVATHSLHAEYKGLTDRLFTDALYQPSISLPKSYVVGKALKTKAATTVTKTSTAHSVVLGHFLTVTIKVTETVSKKLVTGGTIDIFKGTTKLNANSITVSNGLATLRIKAIRPKGAQQWKAQYGGTTSESPSSITFPVTVT